MSLTKSTLGAASGTGQAGYKFTNLGYKARSFVSSVPTWFADQYFDGKRMLLCGQGYHSAYTAGDVSLGPSCVVTAPPTGAHLSSWAGWTSIVGWWPTHDNPATHPRPDRPSWVPALLVNGLDAYPVTKSTWGDYFNSYAWVDTGTKHGLLVAVSYSYGSCGYSEGEWGCAGNKLGWIVLDPAELAEVYAGTRDMEDVTFSDSWEEDFASLDDSSFDWTQDYCQADDIGSLTSVTGNSTTNIITVTKTSHGFSVGQRFTLRGANQASYNSFNGTGSPGVTWIVKTTPSADSFTAGNDQIQEPFAFEATPATGTIVLQKVNNSSGYCGRIVGMTFIPNTNRIAVRIDQSGDALIHFFQVS